MLKVICILNVGFYIIVKSAAVQFEKNRCGFYQSHVTANDKNSIPRQFLSLRDNK